MGFPKLHHPYKYVNVPIPQRSIHYSTFPTHIFLIPKCTPTAVSKLILVKFEDTAELIPGSSLMRLSNYTSGRVGSL